MNLVPFQKQLECHQHILIKFSFFKNIARKHGHVTVKEFRK